jgi:hypothetical protein
MPVIGDDTQAPPPTLFECVLGITYTPEDNETYANLHEFSVVECPAIQMNGADGFFNCNLCGSDEEYSQPIIAGDELWIQNKINLSDFVQYLAFVFDTDGNVVDDSGSGTPGYVVSDNINNYLNLKIVANAIPVDCFYIRLVAIPCEIDEEDLADCVATHEADGENSQQALYNCVMQLCPTAEEYYSEMYRKTNDDCEATLLIQGDYETGYDCAGRYYGGATPYINRVRVPGNIEQTDYDFELEEVFNQTTRNTMKETYRLRTEKIPGYVAAQLAVIWNSKGITIDGVSYFDQTKLQKNNEDGSMWLIDSTLTRECERDFTCD